MPTHMIYLRDSGGMYGYNADERPEVGDMIRLDKSDIDVEITEANQLADGQWRFTAERVTPS